MLLIDKTQSSQTIIVTVSEYPIENDSILKLKVFNKQDNKNYALTLPANSSAHQERYDMFTFPTSSISTWTEGMYIYNIVENNGTTDIQELEIGLLKITGTAPTEYIADEADETADDYVVYDNE